MRYWLIQKLVFRILAKRLLPPARRSAAVRHEPQERQVTWNAQGKQDSFVFSGGVIMVMNRDMPNVPEWEAIATRIAVVELQANEYQMRALMRRVSMQGYELDGRTMDPAECVEVCEYIIAQSQAWNCTLDMRLLINSFADYLQWQEGDAACHWKDLVALRLRKRAGTLRADVSHLSRADRKVREQQIAREIIEAVAAPTERLRLWADKTGKSQAAFYRRAAELGVDQG